MPPSNKQRYKRVAKNLISAAPFIEQNGQVKFCFNWLIRAIHRMDLYPP